MTPTELKSWLDTEREFTLLDVREQNEREYALISPSEWVPMGQIPDRIEELRSHNSIPLIVYCHHGVRSAHVVSFLENNGFQEVHNLEGGIDRWSIEVDNKVPRY